MTVKEKRPTGRNGRFETLEMISEEKLFFSVIHFHVGVKIPFSFSSWFLVSRIITRDLEVFELPDFGDFG